MKPADLLTLVALVVAVLVLVRQIWLARRPSKLRARDREELWPEFKFHMQDRDHAIAAMTMHMAIYEHWQPEGYDTHPAPFMVLLEQAMEETAGWGFAGSHLYELPISLSEEEANRPGFAQPLDYDESGEGNGTADTSH